MSNEFVMVPRYLLTLALSAETFNSIEGFRSHEICKAEAREELRAILAQPAAQHQGEPVAWCVPVSGELFYAKTKVECERERAEYESTSTAEELDEEGRESPAPLYAHANTGEVEKLREDLAHVGENFDEVAAELRYVQGYRDELIAALAERNALLRDIHHDIISRGWSGGCSIPDRIDWAISDGRAFRAPVEHFGAVDRNADSNLIRVGGIGGGSFVFVPNADAEPRETVERFPVTPKMLRAAQIHTELGRYATANLTCAYDLMTELYKVMRAHSEQAPTEQSGYSSALQGNYRNTHTDYSIGDSPTVVEAPRSAAGIDFATMAIESWTEVYRVRNTLRLLVEGLKPFRELDQMPCIIQARATLEILAEKEPRVLEFLLADERAEFETWAASKWNLDLAEIKSARRGNEYSGFVATSAWEGWNARATLERKS